MHVRIIRIFCPRLIRTSYHRLDQEDIFLRVAVYLEQDRGKEIRNMSAFSICQRLYRKSKHFCNE